MLKKIYNIFNRGLLLTLLSLASAFPAFSQSLTDNLRDAKRNYEIFLDYQRKNELDSRAYSSLIEAYSGYADIFRNAAPESEEWRQAKQALIGIFPLLRQGAYYYASTDNQMQVLKFATAYIDLSLLPGMGDEKLNEQPGYPILANLAATNIYNRGNYSDAILYFQAYLNTGDLANRETAFEGLARSYYELQNFDNAAYIASRAIQTYPRNWNCLIIGVESTGRTGNDTKMEEFLRLARKMQPNHAGLIEYQGKMYERMKRFEEAADCFNTLYKMNPQSLDFASHYAFDNYNAGVVQLHRTRSAADKKEQQQLQTQARQYFIKAEPVLKDILDNSPYAVNVARALATCYEALGDQRKLEEANKTLTALRVPAVQKGSMPELETKLMPSADLTPLSAPEAELSAFNSDVDINIPISKRKRENVYAVIIGNEKYKHFSPVAYANRDGKTFAEYCRKTLGIPADNIREVYDATLTEMREPLKFIDTKTQMNPGELDIIFYYAGHGVPDVSKSSAHLLPCDASGTDFESCIELDKLYTQFHEMPAKSVTVFLDACFSGATRGNEMLFAERFVEYEVEDVAARGNTVVFSATSGNQTAMAYDDQQHGFFTYYLLKNLQESEGGISLGNLGKKLTKQVDNKAYDKKNKHQTPTVKASASLGEVWKERTLLD